MTKIMMVGLDLAKSVFQVHAANQDGRPVVCKKLRRARVAPFFATLQRTLLIHPAWQNRPADKPE